MGKAWGEDAGGMERPLTDCESVFLNALGDGPPFFDTWLHADHDGTPWLIVSLTIVNEGAVVRTFRLDFDGRCILGGKSSSHLNGDLGVRAKEAGIDTSQPDGIALESDDPVELARDARAWFHRCSDT